VGHQHRVPVAHLDEDIDRTIERAVDTLVADTRSRRPGPDREVIDLLELRLIRPRLVMLVGWPRAPVAAGRDDLDRDEPLRLERVRGGEVPDVAQGRDPLPVSPTGTALAGT
jgi:hypothetical protein